MCLKRRCSHGEQGTPNCYKTTSRYDPSVVEHYPVRRDIHARFIVHSIWGISGRNRTELTHKLCGVAILMYWGHSIRVDYTKSHV